MPTTTNVADATPAAPNATDEFVMRTGAGWSTSTAPLMFGSGTTSGGISQLPVYASGGLIGPSGILTTIEAADDTARVRIVGPTNSSALWFRIYPLNLTQNIGISYDRIDCTTTMYINPSGQLVVFGGALVTVGNDFGYSSGGSVTQGASRTTGVTLNKPTGAITLVSAAGSTTPATFTVTNSTVAATDTIIVNQKSGTDKYIILVTAVAAGSFDITFYTTGGTTTEQPVFNFVKMDGSAS
jgi:hypothetical protein